ncbi:hypothetical protein [Parendozoicomonas sp. Alg238-R29]|uniref:hypothetical protein n=1 Tax=Parendozoicomonas sp. Alg238-R29 TaxID=2993446 RepID=UPI00248EF0EA|nr:hypothetical protein [Parendozoicomonas sp. Alg238-R29]
MGIDSAGGVQHAQQANYNHQLQEAKSKEQVAAGSLGVGNSVGYYQSGLQVSAGEGQVVPIAEPLPGSRSFPVNTGELEAMLQGLQAESEETISQTNIQATLANQEKTKSVREKRIQDLESQLDPAKNDKKDKCSTAKIVIGALLLPAGAALIADGIQDKKAVKATDNAHKQMLGAHFGEGAGQVESFSKEYAKDSFEEDFLGKPVDTQKHLTQLNELKAKGVIDDDLHQDLSQMVADGASPDAIDDRILNDAIQGYVDGTSPKNEQIERLSERIASRELSGGDTDDGIRSVESDLAQARAVQANDDDFQQFLAQLAMMMEEEQKGLSEVIENLQNGQTVTLEGAKNMIHTKGQMNPTV